MLVPKSQMAFLLALMRVTQGQRNHIKEQGWGEVEMGQKLAGRAKLGPR